LGILFASWLLQRKGDVNSSNHKCLVEWNDVNKTKPWVNYFALSLSNPKPIISFARNNNLLDKMPFCHLTHYCRSTSPAGIKYKFGIQVPRGTKGIKNAIDLDKKNGNQLLQEAIKTELKQLTDYQKFVVLDSGGGYSNRLSEKFLTIWFLMSNMT
jgi:hypothetical protein